MKKFLLGSVFILLTALLVYAGETDTAKILKMAADLQKSGNPKNAIVIIESFKKNQKSVLPEVEMKLAELYLETEQKDPGLTALENVISTLRKKKTESEKGRLPLAEKMLLKKAQRQLAEHDKNGEKLREANEEYKKELVSIIREMIVRKDFRVAKKALEQLEKIDPSYEKLSQLREKIAYRGNTKKWLDLTQFPVKEKAHGVNGFTLNQYPEYKGYVGKALRGGKIEEKAEKWIFISPYKGPSPCYVTYTFSKPIRSFRAKAFLPGKAGSGIFKVFQDGREVFSEMLSKPDNQGPHEINVKFNKPCEELKLQVEHNNNTFAFWLDPEVK